MQEKYWMEFRKELTNQLKEANDKKDLSQYNKDERPIIIVNMAQKIGIKATARYFNITPKTVRYWLNK